MLLATCWSQQFWTVCVTRALCGRFIAGIKDEIIQEKILSVPDGDLMLDRAFQIAESHEAACRNLKRCKLLQVIKQLVCWKSRMSPCFRAVDSFRGRRKVADAKMEDWWKTVFVVAEIIDWLINGCSYNSILCSWADSLCSHVILHEWQAFYSTFLNIHQSGVLTALAWLVPHETAAVSVQVLCTPYNQAPCHFMQKTHT